MSEHSLDNDSETPFSESRSTEGNEKNTPQQALGKVAGRGFSWLSISLVLGKLLSFLVQLVLGSILLDEDFGIFAIAVSTAAFVRCFRDGGVPEVLIQRGCSEFERLCGPAFWISLWFGVAAGALLAALSPLAAWIYGDSELIVLLLVIALSLPLGSPATIFLAKLRSDHRFRTLSKIAIVSQVIRHLGAILLALLGFGALSFVLPLLFVAFFEVVAGYFATRSRLWSKDYQFSEWPGLLRNSVWVLLISFFRGFSLNGDYLVLGLLISQQLLGQYFFGYQLTAQIIVMLSTSIQQVLFPILSRITDEITRQANAIVKSISTLIFLSAPAGFALAVVVEPLESMIWGGKWEAAVPLVQTFAFATSLRGIMSVTHASLSARNKFHVSALLLVLQAVTLMLAAGLGVYFCDGDLTGIAILVTITQATVSTVLSFVVLRAFGVSLGAYLSAIVPPYCVAAASAIICLRFDEYVLEGTTLWLRILVLALTFLVLFCVASRLLLRQCYDNLANVLPNRIAEVLRRVLLLNPSANSC